MLVSFVRRLFLIVLVVQVLQRIALVPPPLGFRPIVLVMGKIALNLICLGELSVCSVHDILYFVYILRICSQAYRLRHRYVYPTPEEMWGPLGIAYEISCARRQALMRLGNSLSDSVHGVPRTPISTQMDDMPAYSDATLTPTQLFP